MRDGSHQLIFNRKFEKNKEGRDFVIGDLHGCIDAVTDFLEEVSFNKEKDRLFAVGDLIDRGPESLKCLDLLRESWFYSTLGNHETFMLDYLNGSCDRDLWRANGGGWAINKALYVLTPYEILLRNMPLSFTVETEKGNVGICHAQPPTNNWNDVSNLTHYQIKSMLWGRQLVKSKNHTPVRNIGVTIHGHSIVDKVTKVGNSFFIDTGIVFGGTITYVEITV